MNYSKYINSKDVRKYLTEVGWKPESAFCAAWLVYQSKNHTLDEKISAWRRLIKENGSETVAGRGITLRAFLEAYISLTKAAIEQFKAAAVPSAYTYGIHYKDIGFHSYRDVYTSYEKAIEAIKANEDIGIADVVAIVIDKKPLDTYMAASYQLVLDNSFSPLAVDCFDEDMSDEDYAIINEIFYEAHFDIPTPFGLGDILTEVNGKYSSLEFYNPTFVFTQADKESMRAVGCFADENGDVYDDYVRSIISCEYLPVKDFEEKDQILLQIHNYLKGSVTLTELLSEYKQSFERRK